MYSAGVPVDVRRTTPRRYTTLVANPNLSIIHEANNLRT